MKLRNLKPSKYVISLAKRLNINVDELNKLTEPELDAILKNLGNHDFVPDSHYNTAELKRGIKIEQEHTDSILVAKLIAKDHLSEDPSYYKMLQKFDKD